jgi:hypothetical protein
MTLMRKAPTPPVVMAPQLQPPDFNRILKNELEENTERFRALEDPHLNPLLRPISVRQDARPLCARVGGNPAMIRREVAPVPRI